MESLGGPRVEGFLGDLPGAGRFQVKVLPRAALTAPKGPWEYESPIKDRSLESLTAISVLQWPSYELLAT